MMWPGSPYFLTMAGCSGILNAFILSISQNQTNGNQIKVFNFVCNAMPRYQLPSQTKPSWYKGSRWTDHGEYREAVYEDQWGQIHTTRTGMIIPAMWSTLFVSIWMLHSTLCFVMDMQSLWFFPPFVLSPCLVPKVLYTFCIFFAVEDHQAKIVQNIEIQTPIWEGLRDGDFLVLLSDT